jgi:hypothetical protein
MVSRISSEVLIYTNGRGFWFHVERVDSAAQPLGGQLGNPPLD